jgi:hypothetical protein
VSSAPCAPLRLRSRAVTANKRRIARPPCFVQRVFRDVK